MSQHCLQLVQPLLVRVLTPKSSRTFELGDARMQRTVLAVGRAEKTQASMWFRAQPLKQGLSEARFADSWFSRYQHDRAVAALHLLPTAHQQLHFFVTAD